MPRGGRRPGSGRKVKETRNVRKTYSLMPVQAKWLEDEAARKGYGSVSQLLRSILVRVGAPAYEPSSEPTKRRCIGTQKNAIQHPSSDRRNKKKSSF